MSSGAKTAPKPTTRTCRISRVNRSPCVSARWRIWYRPLGESSLGISESKQTAVGINATQMSNVVASPWSVM